MANIVLRLSTGSDSTNTNSNPNQALGGKMASNPEAVITTSSSSLNNLFDNISKAENYNGTTDYRCVFIHNDTAVSGDLFAEGEVFITGTPYVDVEIGIGLKNEDTVVIPNENTAPIGIDFTSPTSSEPLLLMPSNNRLDPGEFIAVWIKRTASNITGTGTITDTIPLVVRGIE